MCMTLLTLHIKLSNRCLECPTGFEPSELLHGVSTALNWSPEHRHKTECPSECAVRPRRSACLYGVPTEHVKLVVPTVLKAHVNSTVVCTDVLQIFTLFCDIKYCIEFKNKFN